MDHNSRVSEKTVSASRVVMSKVMEPTDANFLGKVFGGSIMSLLDLNAYAVSARHAENICVTASIDRIDFHHPIEVGWLVVCEGFVSYVGRTSVEVTIEVYAENIFAGERKHTNTARITMVSIKDGKPSPVPRLICETREDRIRFLEGQMRREYRAKQREELAAALDELNALSDAELLARMPA